MKFDEIINEYKIEWGRDKDGSWKTKNFEKNTWDDGIGVFSKDRVNTINAVKRILLNKKLNKKVEQKFDTTTADMEILGDGSAKINFDEGGGMVIPAKEIEKTIKSLKK